MIDCVEPEVQKNPNTVILDCETNYQENKKTGQKNT